MSTEIKDFLKEIKKINPFAEILKDSTIGEIKDFISTGSLILDAITSGKFYNGGIPKGRITALSGMSGVGKSFISANIAVNAQKKGYIVVWFDSERATETSAMERLGIDTKSLLHIPIGTVEEFRIQCFAVLKLLEEKYEGKKDILIVLDSLGNLASEKELNDTSEGKNASDMGQRAKTIKSTLRVLADKIAKLDVTLVVVNHTYANPTNAYAAEIMSGGEGLVYNAWTIINFKKAKIKDIDKEVVGTLLKPTVIKNRTIPPGKTGEIMLNFQRGINKYYGLLDIAIELGLVIKDGKRFKTIKDEKLYWEKDIYSDEFFSPIMEELNEKFFKSSAYFSVIIERGDE